MIHQCFTDEKVYWFIRGRVVLQSKKCHTRATHVSPIGKEALDNFCIHVSYFSLLSNRIYVASCVGNEPSVDSRQTKTWRSSSDLLTIVGFRGHSSPTNGNCPSLPKISCALMVHLQKYRTLWDNVWCDLQHLFMFKVWNLHAFEWHDIKGA